MDVRIPDATRIDGAVVELYRDPAGKVAALIRINGPEPKPQGM